MQNLMFALVSLQWFLFFVLTMVAVAFEDPVLAAMLAIAMVVIQVNIGIFYLYRILDKRDE